MTKTLFVLGVIDFIIILIGVVTYAYSDISYLPAACIGGGAAGLIFIFVMAIIKL